MLGVPVRPAAAQQPDAVSRAPVHFGPIGLAPKFAITNIGVDTNVFNEPVDPKSDFTITTTPGLDLWIRTGDGMLSVQGRADLTYFATYTDQTSGSSGVSGQYEYRFNRVRPIASFSTLNAKERPGYEIDARVRRYEDSFMGGVDVRIASKSFIQFDYRRQNTRYADDASFNGQALNQSLNREVSAIGGVYTQSLTPLTALVVTASTEQERFESETSRNSNSVRTTVGFELGQFALIRGRAFIGFRSLAAADGGTLPSFRGLTANVDASYTAPSQTRLTVRIGRELQHSYDPKVPYYVQTGASLTATQRIIGRWDVQAGAGRDRLNYQPNAADDDRRDSVDQVSGGIGYQLADRVRFGFYAQSQHRISAIPGQTYRTFRFGGSVTYGY